MASARVGTTRPFVSIGSLPPTPRHPPSPQGSWEFPEVKHGAMRLTDKRKLLAASHSVHTVALDPPPEEPIEWIMIRSMVAGGDEPDSDVEQEMHPPYIAPGA